MVNTTHAIVHLFTRYFTPVKERNTIHLIVEDGARRSGLSRSTNYTHAWATQGLSRAKAAYTCRPQEPLARFTQPFNLATKSGTPQRHVLTHLVSKVHVGLVAVRALYFIFYSSAIYDPRTAELVTLSELYVLYFIQLNVIF